VARVDVNPLNYNLRKRLGQIVGDLVGWATNRFAQTSERRSAPTLDGARSFVAQVMAAGQAARASAMPRDVPLQPYSLFDPSSPHGWRDPRLDRQLRGPEVWYGRISSNLGPLPSAWAPEPEITLRYVANVQRKAEQTGWCDEKADLDARALKFDPHFGSVDRIRRSAAFRYPFVIEPVNRTPLAVLCGNFLRAAVDEIDNFIEAMSGLDVATGSGFAMAELVWRRAPLSVPTGPESAVTVPCEIVSTIEPVHNRHVVFDAVRDRPYLCAGGVPNLDPLEDLDGQPRRKFLYHRGFGDYHARSRGYWYAGHFLFYLSGLSLERWSIVLETYGVSTPYAEYPLGSHAHDKALSDIDDALASLGQGKPTKIPEGWKLGHTETPQGLVPLHQAILGFLNAEKSKLVVSNTLTQEMGGVGSYNAMSGHQDQQEDVQTIDATLRAASLRRQLFRDLLAVNAVALARAFSPLVPGGCSPDDIMACSAKCRWDIQRKVSPDQRLKMFIDAANAGADVAEEQVFRECGFRAAASKADRFGQKPAAPVASAAQTPTSPADPKSDDAAVASDGQAGEETVQAATSENTIADK